MKIFTWNTQGSFQNIIDKQNVIRELFVVQGCQVGMLQEGAGDGASGSGWLQLGHPGAIHLFSAHGAGPGAFNARCTNWIVTTHPRREFYSHTIGGGEAGRQGVGVYVDNTLFVSWHSTASDGDDADTVGLVRECLQLIHQGNCRSVIIGADFNTALANLIRAVDSLVTRRPWEDYSYKIFYTSDRTHRNGATLDYFLALYRGGYDATNYTIEVKRVAPSDHDPVIVTISAIDPALGPDPPQPMDLGRSN